MLLTLVSQISHLILCVCFHVLQFLARIVTPLSVLVSVLCLLVVSFRRNLVADIYSASHSRVAPENVGLKKNKNAIHLHVIPVMKCGCVFCEFAKRKLATRKDKTR
jgi:hypothetical protein